MVQGFVISSYVLGLKTLITCMYQQLHSNSRFIRDTYQEIDISALPPGEVMQTTYNGEAIFIRRLTTAEVEETTQLPEETKIDTVSQQTLSDTEDSTKILVTTAACSHLGCIPVPYLGTYQGWQCLCHGSVYDKFGNVRQGPA